MLLNAQGKGYDSWIRVYLDWCQINGYWNFVVDDCHYQRSDQSLEHPFQVTGKGEGSLAKAKAFMLVAIQLPRNDGKLRSVQDTKKVLPSGSA